MPRSEKVTFTGALGDTLAARLEVPDGAPAAWAMFAHCFSCSKNIRAATRIAACLAAQGIGVLRFDFTGLGASEGDFANTNFSSNLGDLEAAATYMRDNHGAVSLLVGHSLGGAAVLAVAERLPEVKAVATIGAPADADHVTHLFADSVPEIEQRGEAEVDLGGRPFRIKRQFLDDIRAQKLTESVTGLGRALLVLHAPRDDTVGIENATRLFAPARHPKSFVSLDDADHWLSRGADADYAAAIIAAWASRYAGAATRGEVAVPVAPPGSVVVSETGSGPFAEVISVGGRHVLRADEPQGYGGDDSGPSPYDFLLAALGACKVMTMRMYANRKGFALRHAAATLKHDKIHAEDCAECETKDGKVDQIAVEIAIDGDLSEEDRRRIFDIAERCPVHRTLNAEVVIQARLADDGAS